jgi:hypothetical protein
VSYRASRVCFADSDSLLSYRTDVKAIHSRRSWIISQLALLIRNASIPKVDAWVFMVLDWFTLNGLFIITRKSEKSDLIGVSPETRFLDGRVILIVNFSCVKYRNLRSPRI